MLFEECYLRREKERQGEMSNWIEREYEIEGDDDSMKHMREAIMMKEM